MFPLCVVLKKKVFAQTQKNGLIKYNFHILQTFYHPISLRPYQSSAYFSWFSMKHWWQWKKILFIHICPMDIVHTICTQRSVPLRILRLLRIWYVPAQTDSYYLAHPGRSLSSCTKGCSNRVFLYFSFNSEETPYGTHWNI